VHWRLTSGFAFGPRSKIGVSRDYFSGPAHRCPTQQLCRRVSRTRPVRCGFRTVSAAG